MLELGGQVGVFGHVRLEQRAVEVDLAVREQRRELGPGQAEMVALALGELLVVWQRLEIAVELVRLLESAQEAPMHVDHPRRLCLGQAQGLGLLVVVLQHELGYRLGHLREQVVSLLVGEVPAGDDRVQQDLDVHLAVRAVDAGRVVDRVGVHLPTGERELDAGALGQPEVPALAHDPAAELARAHPYGVVGLVARLAHASRSSP